MLRKAIEAAKRPGVCLVHMRDGGDFAAVDAAMDAVEAIAGISTSSRLARAAYKQAIREARGGGVTSDVIALVKRAEGYLWEVGALS